MSNLSDVMTLPLQIPETIPNDWSWRNLVELCNPKQWKTISNSDLTETGYRVFGANGFIGYYHEFNHEDETISVTCRGATCGTVNLIPPQTYITGNSMCLDNLSREVSKFYLFYATQFRTFSDVISGSAQPQITGEGLKKVSLPIPPLPEQKKIASILTSVDEVIENTQKQIDKLQDLKKATMNELLTKGIGHTEFKDSELGRIPKSWEVKKLKDIGDCIRGLTYSPDDIAETGLLVLRSSNIQHGRIYLGDNVFVNLDITRKFLTQVGDLLICVRNGSRRLLGKSAIIPEGLPPSTHGAFMTVFRTPLNEYVQFLLQSEWFFTQVSRDIGATINSINNSNLLEYSFAFPTHHEQTQITNQLKSIESLIVEKSNKLSQTQSLKKSLMQDLLTGKVRVTVN